MTTWYMYVYVQHQIQLLRAAEPEWHDELSDPDHQM